MSGMNNTGAPYKFKLPQGYTVLEVGVRACWFIAAIFGAAFAGMIVDNRSIKGEVYHG